MNANRGGKFVNAINRLAKIFSCNLKIIKSSTLLVLSKAIIE
jgi:hypothetical protein